ncbi:TonB-dependent receptor [Flavobacterium galactosidilyticum]|uniref:SusC/RagA family TonB-linked outer membrane protein n=1 Tax=Flavobacterium galactosidilyticum TaxID=2893886 RepID=UPI001E49E643|nr:TonB-dependent receptor [Flavobacterium sp. F-340]UFH45687.1 TonB-dependent receptor [Flavobacterium sp. F-340]
MKIFSKNKPRDLWYDSPARGTTKLATVLLTALTVQLSTAATTDKVSLFESRLVSKTGTTVFNASFIQKKITGKVLDSGGLPIPGANIVAKGSTASTQTDFDGNFSIDVPANVTKLIVSYIGMESQEVSIGKSPLTITLKESGESLDEVVIVGYGTQKRSKITGSVSKLDNKVLQTGVRSNPASALAGTIPGLRVQQSSGRPGAVPSIVLRGGTNYDGSGSPLVMVDGFIRAGFSEISQDDIASIEVLKDASATAIYGARANNGVILITTKKGKNGTSNITINSKVGINTLNIPFDFLDAKDYLYWSRKAIETSGKYDAGRLTQLNGIGPFGTGNVYKDVNGNILDGNKVNTAVWSPMFRNPINEELLSQGWQSMIDPLKTNALGAYDLNGTNKEIIYKDFNYKDYALRPQGLTKDYSINMTGGNEKGNYYASIGSFDEQGLPINTFYKRLTFVFNGEYKIKPWLTSTSSINFADAKWRDSQTAGEGNYLTRALGAPPTMRGTNANGDLLVGRDSQDGNPAVNDDKFIRNNTTDKFTLSQSFKFDILKNLSFSTSANWFYSYGYNEAFNKDFLSSPGNTNKTRSSSAGYSRDFSQTYNGALNYNTKFLDKNNISVMIGSEYYDIYQNGLSASGSGAPSDDFMDLEYTSGDKDRRNIDTYHQRQRILSFFSRVNYDYDDKYLMTLTVRRDGYSRLLNNRWGNFPGISVGWNMHKENFFSGISDVVNTLKLRASYGQNANVSGIGAYQLQGRYNSGKYDGILGYQAGGLPFPDLKWERSSTYEVGVDTRLFSKLDLSFAFYDRETNDKISTFQLPVTSGITQITTNLGSFQNKGVELDLNYSAVRTQDWSLDINTNFATNTNKILKLPNNGLENNRIGGSQVYDDKGNLVWVGGFQEGQDPNQAYAYVAEGIIRTQADLDSYALQLRDLLGARTLVHPDVFNAMTPAQKALHYPIALGDVKWKDVNGDGIINSYDREYMGRTVPKMTGGFGFTARYKSFTLSSRLDYALGFVQYDGPTTWFLSNAQGTFNTIQDVKNTWTPENPNAKYPTYYWADQLYKNNTFRTSSMFYNKADYLAFREVNLSYSLPSELLSKAKIEGIKLTLTGQNLGYLSKSTLFSPEATENGTSVGGGYPLPRTVIFGIQIIL